MTRVCIVTGSRADYGLLRWIIEGVQDSEVLDLQIVVTGMHLSPEFGLTWREIESDGFRIDRKVETLLSSDTPVGIAKSIGLGVIGFADAYADLEPDIVLVLGDRYEIFAAATAAMAACIPIAHIHGGESTEGAIDESIRHAITKMSHLHFVSTEDYRRRVIQLGEQPERVFLVGAPGLDSLHKMKFLNRKELEESLGFTFGLRNLLITFHPTTLEANDAELQMSELLAALNELPDTQLIFTQSNADTNGRMLIKMVETFAATRSNAHVYTSLGQQRYLSCIREVDGVVGNSSSGIIEVPSFNKGSVNIGNRQKGRVKASSVIDCPPNRAAILDALSRLYSDNFQEALHELSNPYGSVGASERVIGTLTEALAKVVIAKPFYDQPYGA